MEIDTRKLMIGISEQKFISWQESIDKMITNKFALGDELETLFGRMTHLSIIISQVLHFLSRLRTTCEKIGRRKKSVLLYKIRNLKPGHTFGALFVANHFLNDRCAYYRAHPRYLLSSLQRLLFVL